MRPFILPDAGCRKVRSGLRAREALSVWLCRQHNAVNAKLGKPAFPCDVAALDARWRTGARECWPDDAETAEQSLGRE